MTDISDTERKRLRIALVGDAGSTNVRDWAKGLESAGAHVDLISFRSGPDHDSKVHELRSPKLFGPRSRYLLAGRSIRHLISRLEPDLIIGYFVTGYGTVARLSRRSPVVQVAVGSDVLVTPALSIAHLMARRNLKSAQLVVAWSPHLSDAIKSFGVDADRIVSLTGGIPLELIANRGKLTGDPHKLVVSRSLSRYYKHEILIQALSKLDDVDACLTLIGTGPQRDELQRVAFDLGLTERVEFTGWLTGESKLEKLCENGIYVSACPTDGASASLLEAMAIGLFPIVADHVSNREWIVDGENGFLVEGTPDAYAMAVRRAINSPELVQDSRQINRDLVFKHADLRKNSSLFVDMFTNLLDVV